MTETIQSGAMLLATTIERLFQQPPPPVKVVSHPKEIAPSGTAVTEDLESLEGTSLGSSTRSFEVDEDIGSIEVEDVYSFDGTDPHSKLVRFDLDNVQYHGDKVRSLLDVDECTACWYDSTALLKMKQDSIRSAKKLVSKRQKVTSALRCNASTSPMKPLTQAYVSCSGIKTEVGVEQGIDPVERQRLQHAYEASDSLWGLEDHLIVSLRGGAESDALCRMILSHAQRQLDGGNRAASDKIFYRLSLAVSRPSRAFAQEVAAAQAAVVAASL